MKVLGEKHPLPVFSAEVLVADIDGAKIRSLRSFYTRIARILHFPDYFGKNLDALYDCLCSLEHVGRQEVVLVIRNFDTFLEKEKPEKRAAALQVLRDAEIQENRGDAVVFHVLAQH